MCGWIAAFVWLLLVIGVAGDHIGWVILLTVLPYGVGWLQRSHTKVGVVTAVIIGIPSYLFVAWELITGVWGDGSSVWNQITAILALIVILPIALFIGFLLYLMGADLLGEETDSSGGFPQ